jgi:DNA-binding NtrC family response regulator
VKLDAQRVQLLTDPYRRAQAMAVPSYRLLVIDDSKRDTLLLERILQQAEDATFAVTHAESARAGLEELNAQAYDLVLLDYYLPDMDGIAFLQEKQKRGLTAPVIMLTAFDQERLPVAALQAGALDYFRKDQVNSGLLGKAIRQAIEKARLQANAVADAKRVRELEAMVAQLQQRLKDQQGS